MSRAVRHTRTGIRLRVLALLAGLAAPFPAAQAPDSSPAHRIPFFPSGSDSFREGFARVINRSPEAGTVQVDAYDDMGRHYGPLVLSIDAGKSAHFNSNDLENGNAGKGLQGGTGTGQGDWRLSLGSSLDIEVLAYVRTTEGFLASMHDLVTGAEGRYPVATFNPGSNTDRVSLLRLMNAADETAEVSITGIDDTGASPGGTVTLSIPAGAARSYSSAELETGDAPGLEGSLGNGSGKWQLVVQSGPPIFVMSLLSSPTGHLTNLSSAPWGARGMVHRPDLAVGSPTVSDASLNPGAAFTLSTTVTNAGNGDSAATTLRYYRSTNTTISTLDRQVGTAAVSALPASGKSPASISLRAPSTLRTYYYGACVDAVEGESDTSNNCSPPVRVDVAQVVEYPNLTVGTPSVGDANPEAGRTFTLSATVTNAGGEHSTATTLRFHTSSTATISMSDTQVGTGAVGALATSATRPLSIVVTAPSTVGSHYYGACVDAVEGESNTADNCSPAVQVDVTERTPRPDLEVGTPQLSDPSLDMGESFTLSATVTNRGNLDSPATMLRYYNSPDATISTTDTQFGASSVEALPVEGTSEQSVTLTAPSPAGTYYYGACVDAVEGESDRLNNCSPAARLNVKPPPVTTPGFDIDMVFVDPQPTAAYRSAIGGAAAVWETAIANDLADMDFSDNPLDNVCTEGEFDGFVDDLRIYVYVVDLDGAGGTTADAGFCTGRGGAGTPVIGRIRFDSADLYRIGTGVVRLVAVHEIAHVLGFGSRWDNLQNPSIQGGEPVDPPPDTHWPGSNAVAAFNAAGGSNYTGGKVPVENEHGGRGARDKHWRKSAMPGELMTHNLDGSALSAITVQSMADLGYSVNADAADSYTVSVSGAPPLSPKAGELPLRCDLQSLDVESVPESGRREPP